MTADVKRDGRWAISALQRIVENGGDSESVGCRISRLVGDDIKMNAEFAKLLVNAIRQLEQDLEIALTE